MEGIVISLSNLPLPLLAVLFVIAAVFVWIAGSHLALCGDELAERFKLTREFVGLIILATVTEFPEIVTTITAAQVDNAALVLG
ncbi:MAG: sodium:calcium antiporter, partial [Hyphomicrobiales bacterium]|nr:sodium:calcium antiporter [Hyphomicrobiales bacterium]